MLHSAKLKTPIGVLSAVPGEAFDNHQAILIWIKNNDTKKDSLIAEIRYNPNTKSIEMGDFCRKLVPEFTTIYE